MKVVIKCKNCGKDFSVHNYIANKAKFCSRECFKSYNKVNVKCHRCGENFEVHANREKTAKFCSIECRRQPVDHKYKNNGYILVKKHDGYMYDHRIVMSKYLGRPLRNDEHVHHKNEDRSDNRIENLEIFTVEEHIQHHCKLRHAFKWITLKCTHCGKAFSRYKSAAKLSNNNYCSKDCYHNDRQKEPIHQTDQILINY